MADFIKASQVFFDNPATTVDEVLVFLAQQAVAQGISDDEAAILEAFRAREALGTTGMTGGFAIPHCKSDAVKEASVILVKFAPPACRELLVVLTIVRKPLDRRVVSNRSAVLL